MKKILKVLISMFLVAGLFGCAPVEKDDDIIILFTNDVHCGIEEGVTLAAVSAYKKKMQTVSKYVTLVDCGDQVQGSYLGTVSKGEVSIKAMNAVGYDYAILGNHEFDYGMERLKELMEMNEATYLNCNVSYTGKNEDIFTDTKPYEIVTYGKTKVAFIGVSTPTTITDSTPTNFMEDNEFVYDFKGGNNGRNLYETIQTNVDEVKSKGADYVILLAHLGMEEAAAPYRSADVIANTSGIDVVLDAHSHSIYTMYGCKNKDGDYVLCGQTGTKLENIGQLVITSSGLITLSNISDISEQDEEAENLISGYISQYEESLNTIVGKTDHKLDIADENGIRLVRSRETVIGDLNADAYRYVSGADIAYVNGGGIRAALPEGDISYKDIISVNPFGNMLCVVEVTGSEILDMLEYFASTVQKEYVKDGNAYGENGSFANVSGLKFTIDTSIKSPAIIDEKEMLIDVEGERRVSDVMVLENGEYVAIEPDKTYTLASHDYMIKNGGCGMLYKLADHKLTVDCAMADYQVLVTYIVDYLNGDLSSYKETEGRVTVK